MTVRIIQGDCRTALRILPGRSINCCVTSPPYLGLRNYEMAGQIGLEHTVDEYVEQIVRVFRDVHRLLRDDGVLWLNLGDCYAGSWGAQSREHAGKQASNVSAISANQVKAAQWRAAGTGSLARTPGLKPKDLVGLPWRVAFALQADGWWLRQHLPWVKRNPMPESTTDRPTCAVEEVFMLTKSRHYFYDYDAVRKGMAPASEARLSQNVTEQAGSTRANGGRKTNGVMKAVKGGKQRGHSRRHVGFNERWDELDRDAQRGVRAFRNNDLFIASLSAPHGAVGTRDDLVAIDVGTHSFKEAHFATFPPALIEPLILAGCPRGGGSARSIRRRWHDRPCRGSAGTRCDTDRVEPALRRDGRAADQRRQGQCDIRTGQDRMFRGGGR